MKAYYIVIVLSFFILCCSGKKGIIKVSASENIENVKDSVEYELITFDGQFETWYSLNNSPALYRSQEYYEIWNERYVSAWNIKSNRDPFFESIVGYNYGVDYGFELNHRLFYYFQYVENVLKKPIISGARPKITLFN